MMAPLLWLLYILGKQLGMEAVIWAGAFLLMVGIACWVIGRLSTLTATRLRYAASWIVAVALITVGFWAFVSPLLRADQVLLGESAGAGSTDEEAITWRALS